MWVTVGAPIYFSIFKMCIELPALNFKTEVFLFRSVCETLLKVLICTFFFQKICPRLTPNPTPRTCSLEVVSTLISYSFSLKKRFRWV